MSRPAKGEASAFHLALCSALASSFLFTKDTTPRTAQAPPSPVPPRFSSAPVTPPPSYNSHPPSPTKSCPQAQPLRGDPRSVPSEPPQFALPWQTSRSRTQHRKPQAPNQGRGRHPSPPSTVQPTSSPPPQALLSEPTRQPDPDADTDSTRALYVSALGHMLRSLPTDLTPAEHDSLHASLPPSLRGDGPSRLGGTYLEIDDAAQAYAGESWRSWRPSSDLPALLRRALAATIEAWFVFMAALLPYIGFAWTLAQRWVTKHRVHERAGRWAARLVAGAAGGISDGVRKGWDAVERARVEMDNAAPT